MSLLRVPKDDLYAFAKDQQVAVEDFSTKPKLLKELDELGLTIDDYQAWEKENDAEELVVAQEEERELAKSANVEEDEEKVLVRMRRNNPYYEYSGVEFTRENPFQFLTRKQAAALIASEEGFSRAHEDDVREFYNQ